jgi:hypothetical protein
LLKIRETSSRSFAIKIINRDARLQAHSASHHLVLHSQRIYSQAQLRSLPAHLSSAVRVARVEVHSEAQVRRQALLVLALEASDKPSPRNLQQVLELEYLGRPLVSNSSSHNNSSSNNNNNNNNNLLASGVSGSHSSPRPRPGPASLVLVVIHLGSRISPPLA